jgi:hypothetical protein
MKQKYLLLKNDEKKELLIKEFAESDKESFSLLCEESYDSKEIESAIAKDKKALLSTCITPKTITRLNYFSTTLIFW